MENVSLLLFLFHVSTYALFYQAQSNQSQKETNVPYPTPNQTKLAIFTKHSNGNINTSCCGCQGSSPRTRMWVLDSSQTKTCVVRAHPLRRSSVYWKEHFHTHKDIFLRLVNLVPRRYPRETQFFEMLSPCLSEWQLLCGVWQQVEVFGRSLPTSMSESQRALQ